MTSKHHRQPSASLLPAALTSRWPHFINASQQRFISPLLLNFLCLTRAPGRRIDRLSERYTERENRSTQPSITEYPDDDEETTDLPTSACPNLEDRPLLVDHYDDIINAIFAFLQSASDGQISKTTAYENDGKTIDKKYARPIILLLGTLRLKTTHQSPLMVTVRELTTQLQESIARITCLFHVRECLKNDHRECDIASSRLLDNGETVDDMIRRCLAIKFELHQKALSIRLKWQQIKQAISTRLAQQQPVSSDQTEAVTENRHHNRDLIYEARDVATALKEAYEQEADLVEQGRQIRAQLEQMTNLIDNTRQLIIKLSAQLMTCYRTTFLYTQRTKNIVMCIPGIPVILTDTLMIETYCADLLQTIEAMRQFSINADKLIESRYDSAIAQTICPLSNDKTATAAPPSRLLHTDNQPHNAFSQKYEAIDRLYWDSLMTNHEPSSAPPSTDESQVDDPQYKKERHIARLSDIYHAFIEAVQKTRYHVSQHLYCSAPHDIRVMTFCFFTILGKRLTSDDTLLTMAQTSRLIPTPIVDATSDTLMRSLDNIAREQINLYESDQLINIQLSDKLATQPYLAQRHLTARSIGDIAIHLRNEQNIFQLNYVVNAISRQLERIQQQRHHPQKTAPPAGRSSSAVNPALDESIVSSLHSINEANFDLNGTRWDHTQQWPFTGDDTFRFTQVAARLAHLKKNEELSTITELVALYAYLLSYKLEQILFIPKPELESDQSEQPSPEQDTEQSQANIPNTPPSSIIDDQARRLTLKRPHAPHHAVESDSEPSLKRAAYGDQSLSDSDEEMPMIIDPPSEQASKTIPSVTADSRYDKSPKKGHGSSHAYLHQPKYHRKTMKRYRHLYPSKQALHLFYKQDTITNLGDILQGVRFEKKRKADTIASYQTTLRRLNAHLDRLHRKKK